MCLELTRPSHGSLLATCPRVCGVCVCVCAWVGVRGCGNEKDRESQTHTHTHTRTPQEEMRGGRHALLEDIDVGCWRMGLLKIIASEHDIEGDVLQVF
jgi:hypothetical protein